MKFKGIGVTAVVFKDSKEYLPTIHSEIYALDCSKGRGIILPGGKLEESDKTYSDAAARELLEELNITVVPNQFETHYESMDARGYYCYSFVWRNYLLNSPEGYSGREGTRVTIPLKQLLENKVFGGYYELLIDHLYNAEIIFNMEI